MRAADVSAARPVVLQGRLIRGTCPHQRPLSRRFTDGASISNGVRTGSGPGSTASLVRFRWSWRPFLITSLRRFPILNHESRLASLARRRRRCVQLAPLFRVRVLRAPTRRQSAVRCAARPMSGSEHRPIAMLLGPSRRHTATSHRGSLRTRPGRPGERRRTSAEASRPSSHASRPFVSVRTHKRIGSRDERLASRCHGAPNSRCAGVRRPVRIAAQTPRARPPCSGGGSLRRRLTPACAYAHLTRSATARRSAE